MAKRPRGGDPTNNLADILREEEERKQRALEAQEAARLAAMSAAAAERKAFDEENETEFNAIEERLVAREEGVEEEENFEGIKSVKPRIEGGKVLATLGGRVNTEEVELENPAGYKADDLKKQDNFVSVYKENIGGSEVQKTVLLPNKIVVPERTKTVIVGPDGRKTIGDIYGVSTELDLSRFSAGDKVGGDLVLDVHRKGGPVYVKAGQETPAPEVYDRNKIDVSKPGVFEAEVGVASAGSLFIDVDGAKVKVENPSSKTVDAIKGEKQVISVWKSKNRQGDFDTHVTLVPDEISGTKRVVAGKGGKPTVLAYGVEVQVPSSLAVGTDVILDDMVLDKYRDGKPVYVVKGTETPRPSDSLIGSLEEANDADEDINPAGEEVAVAEEVPAVEDNILPETTGSAVVEEENKGKLERRAERETEIRKNVFYEKRAKYEKKAEQEIVRRLGRQDEIFGNMAEIKRFLEKRLPEIVDVKERQSVEWMVRLLGSEYRIEKLRMINKLKAENKAELARELENEGIPVDRILGYVNARLVEANKARLVNKGKKDEDAERLYLAVVGIENSISSEPRKYSARRIELENEIIGTLNSDPEARSGEVSVDEYLKARRELVLPIDTALFIGQGELTGRVEGITKEMVGLHRERYAALLAGAKMELDSKGNETGNRVMTPEILQAEGLYKAWVEEFRTFEMGKVLAEKSKNGVLGGDIGAELLAFDLAQDANVENDVFGSSYSELGIKLKKIAGTPVYRRILDVLSLKFLFK